LRFAHLPVSTGGRVVEDSTVKVVDVVVVDVVDEVVVEVGGVSVEVVTGSGSTSVPQQTHPDNRMAKIKKNADFTSEYRIKGLKMPVIRVFPSGPPPAF
jgi:hypothetical protein